MHAGMNMGEATYQRRICSVPLILSSSGPTRQSRAVLPLALDADAYRGQQLLAVKVWPVADDQ